MLRFLKVTLVNLNFKFSEVICDKIWFKAKLIWNKNRFVEETYYEKNEREAKIPLLV